MTPDDQARAAIRTLNTYLRLDGNGQPLAIDKPDVFLTYSKYEERDWQDLMMLKFFA